MIPSGITAVPAEALLSAAGWILMTSLKDVVDYSQSIPYAYWRFEDMVMETIVQD